MEAADPGDRAFVTRWARALDGRILDLGCGPGHWTDHLRRHGCDVYGVDPVETFIAGARRRFPKTTFTLGRAQQIDEPDAALAGVLAWYSLIHLAPSELDTVLRELARCLRPGGGLLMGFFEWPVAEPFDHAVVTAHRWPVNELCSRLVRAGFTIAETVTRAEPGQRPQAAIVAHRSLL
jgi:ubiquinone/menaquinone biosynthesis C-methylase UbiE